MGFCINSDAKDVVSYLKSSLYGRVLYHVDATTVKGASLLTGRCK